MPRLRETPSPQALVDGERAVLERRRRDAIERRLARLELERDHVLRAASACRRAADHLPDGSDRDELLRRADALGADLDPFEKLRALQQDAVSRSPRY